jgi:hypothetical protein
MAVLSQSRPVGARLSEPDALGQAGQIKLPALRCLVRPTYQLTQHERGLRPDRRCLSACLRGPDQGQMKTCEGNRLDGSSPCVSEEPFDGGMIGSGQLRVRKA